MRSVAIVMSFLFLFIIAVIRYSVEVAKRSSGSSAIYATSNSTSKQRKQVSIIVD